MTELPTIGLIHTGGTLESVGTSRLDIAWYMETEQRVEEGELLDAVPEFADVARITTVPRSEFPDRIQTPSQWLALRGIVQSLIDEDRHAGIVITHGTSALEETAYFLDLTLDWRNPVVLVGAMRPWSALSADGHLNLLRALQVAASPDAVGQGVLVAMNDSIFTARDATKAATRRVDAFAGRDVGPIGAVDGDGSVLFFVRRHDGVRRVPTFDVAGIEELPRVDVVLSHVGADGALIDAAVAAGARGVVVAGMGAGNPVESQTEAIKAAVSQGVVVCQSTRVMSGPVRRSPRMRERGTIAAGTLSPWKARILLSLSLTRTHDPEQIQELFDLVG